jgi:hypothetical protein
MTQIDRIGADETIKNIRGNPPHPRHPRSIIPRLFRLLA